ncbi:hypothetical protein KC327_g82 [Hortaea werneckii]|nr:hypothetical protein KC327_g82 [Hortaea werneckii]
MRRKARGNRGRKAIMVDHTEVSTEIGEGKDERRVGDRLTSADQSFDQQKEQRSDARAQESTTHGELHLPPESTNEGEPYQNKETLSRFTPKTPKPSDRVSRTPFLFAGSPPDPLTSSVAFRSMPFLSREGAFSWAVFPICLGPVGTGCSVFACFALKADASSVPSTSHTSARFYLAAAVLLGWSVCTVLHPRILQNFFHISSPLRVQVEHTPDNVSLLTWVGWWFRSCLRVGLTAVVMVVVVRVGMVSVVFTRSLVSILALRNRWVPCRWFRLRDALHRSLRAQHFVLVWIRWRYEKPLDLPAALIEVITYRRRERSRSQTDT